jgi:hypothetical protein
MSNMPLYFMIFLATLAASLLLYLGAIATVAIMRRPPPLFIRGVAASRLQATGVALLWSGVGVGWLLFFNVYRIHVDLSAFGDAAFQAFSRGYTRRLPIVVLPYGVVCENSAHPTEDGVGGHDSGDVRKAAPAEDLAFHG